MLTWYRNAKTSHKLITAFILMALIVGGVGTLGLTKVKLLNAFINDLYNDSLVMTIDLGHAGREASDIRMTALKMTSGLYNDRLQRLFDEANASAKKADKLIEKYSNDLHGSEVRPYEEMRDAWKAFNGSRIRTMTLALAGETEKAGENARGDAGNKYSLFDEKLEALIDIQDKDGRELFDRSVKSEKSATLTIIVAVILSMLAAIGAGLFISSLIAAPLGNMAEAARKIARGDLGVNVEAATRDEVGILSAVFNNMAESIDAAQNDLKQDAAELLSLAVSSNVVIAIPRTENIYEAACSLAVKELGVRMAWCGVLKEGCRDIEPVAHCGSEEGDISSGKITWDDSPSGRGPAGLAVRTKAPSVVNDISTDPAYAPWRDEALKRGYRSAMALPLLDSEAKVLGVMNLHSDAPRYFTRKRVRIFTVFANQVAAALENRSLIRNVEKTSGQIDEQLKTIIRSKNEWQATFDSITDLVTIHDRDYNIFKANKAVARHFGRSFEELLGKKCYDIFHDTCSPVVNCPHRSSMLENRDATEEVREPKTGKLFRVSTFPYYSTEGAGLIGSVHIARDITVEKDTELRLIMSERLAALGQIASGVAHEINTPLASIAGCAEGLLMKVKANRYDPVLFEEYLRIVEEEVLRCKNITTGMLSFVRTASYDKKDVRINEALDKTLEIISFQGRIRDYEIVRNYQADLPVINASEGELRQVFIAIITNALDAMENSGTLTVETKAEGGSVIIKIADSGPGIAKEHLSKIFDPFFTTKMDKGGTGLGLSIAFKIISNHNGTIDARSEEGKGAAFTLALPLLE